MEISHFNPNQSAPSIYIRIELCYFSLDQWEIRIHLLWGKSFNIPNHCDPHQTKFNGLLPLTIPGVLTIANVLTFKWNGWSWDEGLNSWVWKFNLMCLLSIYADEDAREGNCKGHIKDSLNLLKQFLGRSSVWCFPKRHLQTFTHNVKGKMKKGKSSRNGSFVTLKLISLEAELGLVSSAQIRLYSSLFPLLLYFIVLTPSPPHPPKKKKQSSTMLGDCDAMEI